MRSGDRLLGSGLPHRPRCACALSFLVYCVLAGRAGGRRLGMVQCAVVGVVAQWGGAYMQGATVRKASCLAESGVVQPGWHTRYADACAARMRAFAGDSLLARALSGSLHTIERGLPL